MHRDIHKDIHTKRYSMQVGCLHLGTKRQSFALQKKHGMGVTDFLVLTLRIILPIPKGLSGTLDVVHPPKASCDSCVWGLLSWCPVLRNGISSSCDSENSLIL